MPYLGVVEHTGPTAMARSGSAQRLRAAYGAYRLREELATAFDGLDGGPILVVDNRTDADGTITVVAQLLRQAGTDPVPLRVVDPEG